MRQLIISCDGTWQAETQASVTNVVRLHNALVKNSADGNEQLAKYFPGVGTTGSLPERLLGGATGTGLADNVMETYHWLTTTYKPGDRISLFGFSRGAYTVRSVAGMIAACGLLDTTGLDTGEVWHRIKHVYRRKYRPGPDADPSWRDGHTFRYDPDDAEEIPLHFLGVWDTVGSLGIPDNLGLLNLLDSPHYHNFHDVKLNPHVPHARHAVAMDETRGPFAPTLWEDLAPDQDVKQVWFPGSHQDVGGGHHERGLSDGALLWMIGEAQSAVELDFDKAVVTQLQPDPLDILHGDSHAVSRSLGSVLAPILEPRPRAVPLIDPHAQSGKLHASVYERHQGPPIAGKPYRPTQVLAVGESATVTVLAHQPWNESGLYLETGGDYAFAAEGKWANLLSSSGPAGITGLRRFHPLEAGRLIGTAIGWGERLFQRGTGNKAARFIGSRREEELPWMSLVGVVANDLDDGPPKAHERIPIGTGTSYRVTKSGYFYAFANDAWGFYGNNQGNVRLTVTRTA